MIDEEFERKVERALRVRGALLQVTPRSYDDVIRDAAKKRLERRAETEESKQAQLALEDALRRRAETLRMVPTPFDLLISTARATAISSGRAPTHVVEDPIEAKARLSRITSVKHRGTTVGDNPVPVVNPPGHDQPCAQNRPTVHDRPALNDKPVGWTKPKIMAIGALCLSVLGGALWWATKPSNSQAADTTFVVEQNSPGSGFGAGGTPGSSTTLSTTTTTTTSTTTTTRPPTTIAATVPPTTAPITAPPATTTTTTTTIPVAPRTLTVEKINGNRPPTIALPSGTYNFRIFCGSIESSAAIAYPATPSWTSPALPAAASSCVVAEIVPLPAMTAAPAAPWQDPFFYKTSPTTANLIAGTGYSRTIPLNPSGNTLVIVANRFL